MATGFLGLTIVFLIAAVLGILARLLKQPLVLAFIITGAIISYFGFFHLDNREIFDLFSDLGIMFLLFLIGLEINYSSLKMVGKTSLLVGLGQIVFTSLFGFLIANLLNFSYLHSAYIAVALTFSSTIIIVKLLSEKKDLNSLYGKISIGFLLVQDFVAILLLIFLAGIEKSGTIAILPMGLTLVKGIFLFAIMLWLGRKIIPLIFDKIARSQEMLFLVSLAWVFALVFAVNKFGFSIEIGGFLAGLALANSSEHFQIASRIKSLRDFFILIFFVILGSSVAVSDFSGITWPILVFSIFVLIGNPLIVLAIMGLLGYRKRTSFMCGVTVAQISEFSLVLAALGLKVGHINESIVALITAVGIVTITLSTYLIIYSDAIFRKLSRILSWFEKKHTTENGDFGEVIGKPVVLIGSHRIGQSIALGIPKDDVLIVDFDPQVIHELKQHSYAHLFGDASDEEVFDRIDFSKVKVVISTVPDLQDNLALLERMKKIKREYNVRTIVRTDNEREVEILYKAGADYVLFPHLTSGQYVGKSLMIDPEMKIIDDLRKLDLRILRKLERKNS